MNHTTRVRVVGGLFVAAGVLRLLTHARGIQADYDGFGWYDSLPLLPGWLDVAVRSEPFVLLMQAVFVAALVLTVGWFATRASSRLALSLVVLAVAFSVLLVPFLVGTPLGDSVFVVEDAVYVVGLIASGILLMRSPALPGAGNSLVAVALLVASGYYLTGAFDWIYSWVHRYPDGTVQPSGIVPDVGLQNAQAITADVTLVIWQLLFVVGGILIVRSTVRDDDTDRGADGHDTLDLEPRPEGHSAD